jgi:putative peptide zinc metalloprotease protein
MRAIIDYVSALPCPEELKKELTGKGVLEQHELYLQLPYWLAPLFGPVTPAQVEQLGFSSYFYFRFLVAIDGLLDAPAPQAAGGHAVHRLLVYCDLFEQSVRGLGALFPQQDPFWAALDRCKQQYAGANIQEKKLSRAPGPFSKEMFEQLAADKSAVCNAIVYALSSLGGTTAPVAPLVNCLRHLHVALQCVDDVEDFNTDWQQGQYTYAHALVKSFLEREGIDVSPNDGEALHRYFYTSGTAGDLLQLAQEHFAQAIEISQQLGLTDLANILEYHNSRCAFHRADYAQKVARAQERASAAVQPAGVGQPMLTDAALIRPFNATQWVIAAPEGRNLLVNAPAAELFHLLAQVDNWDDALVRFNARFEAAFTPAELADLVATRFGGYQLLRDDGASPRAPYPQNMLRLQVEFLPPAAAGALSAPLRPLYGPRVFWWTMAALLAYLLVDRLLLGPAPLPTGTGWWVAASLVYASMLVHECGHIAATARAGVRAGGIGFGFYAYVFPVLYADVTAIWHATRQQRIIANLGGIFSQLLFAVGLAVAGWASGYAPLRFAAGGVGLMALWQLNPFVQHDGYWLLSDLTNTPNLLPKANAVLRQALSWPALQQFVASRGRALLDRRALLFAYAIANASLLLFFVLYTCLHHAQLVLTFPYVLSALLLKLLNGTLHAADVSRAQFAVLAFYLVLARFVAGKAGKWFKRPLAPSGV